MIIASYGPESHRTNSPTLQNDSVSLPISSISMILLIILVFTTIQSNTLSRIHLFLSSHLFFFVFIVVLFQTRQIFALQMYTMIILIMFGLVLVPFYMTICILEPSFFPSMIPMDYRQSSEETHLLSTLQSQLYQLCVYKLFREGCIEM